jgi:hypothetical protein
MFLSMINLGLDLVSTNSAPALHNSTTVSPHQMGAQISQIVKSHLENSTVEELLIEEKVSLIDFKDMNYT